MQTGGEGRLLFLLIVLAVALILWFVPLKLRISFHQRSLDARVQLQVQAPLVKLRREVHVSEKIEMALEHMLKRWRAKGEPVKVPLQTTIRRLPRKKLLRVVGRPLRYLMRRMRCTRLDARAEVGAWDAMESALLAGAVWSVSGVGIGLFSRRVQLDPAVPRITVIPSFRGPAWRVQTDCILHFRLGHAIVAGLWLVRRALREKELVAWARDSWRRKGVDSSGGSSDPGPDEDGHGEH